MFATIITSLIGAMCIAGVFAAIKSRWLYVIAPKLYLHTPISDGQIVTLNIYNAGLTAEEDVAITFRTACKFELIATSKSTLAVNGKTLSITKLSRLESVTIVLLIEGKAFDPIDIESVESKATRGKIVESKEKATGFWQYLIVLPMALLLFVIPFGLGTMIGADTRTSAIDYLDEKFEIFRQSKQLAGFKSHIREDHASSKFEGAIKKAGVAIETVEVIRRGDVLTIKTKLSNNTKEPLLVDLFLKSSAGERGSLSFGDGRIEDFAIGPGEKKSVTQKAFLPETLATKILENRINFQDLKGDYLRVSQVMEFN